MDLTKRKYKQSEVQVIIDDCKSEYEAKLVEQKGRIFELTKENSKLISALETYKDKESLINATLQRAEKNAKKLSEKAEIQYSLEIERLRTFVHRWEKYFSMLKEKYPVYAPVLEAIDLREKLLSVLKLSNSFKAIDKLNKALCEKQINFGDKYNANDYVAVSENGFNLDEVLNPGDLELEDLCKELGLLDE